MVVAEEHAGPAGRQASSRPGRRLRALMDAADGQDGRVAGGGSLRTYPGTAPGVGKTFAMLARGRRRARAGERVVVGWLESHDRPQTSRRAPQWCGQRPVVGNDQTGLAGGRGGRGAGLDRRRDGSAEAACPAGAEDACPQDPRRSPGSRPEAPWPRRRGHKIPLCAPASRTRGRRARHPSLPLSGGPVMGRVPAAFLRPATSHEQAGQTNSPIMMAYAGPGAGAPAHRRAAPSRRPGTARGRAYPMNRLSGPAA